MTKSLLDIDKFGDVAAEDDAVLDYFLKTESVGKIENNETLLVLGRKGSGKTALVKYFSEKCKTRLSKALSLKGYPWNIHGLRIDHGASEIEAYVSSWRYLISLEFSILALSKARFVTSKSSKSIEAFLIDNYGGTNPDLKDILKPSKLKLSKTSFEPQVLGNKIGSVSFDRAANDLGLGSELSALSETLLDAAIKVAKEIPVRGLMLHFDELDQGLSSLDNKRKAMITGIILAAREVRNKCQSSGLFITPVVYLRTDIWDDLQFSDKNKLNQTASLRLDWDEKNLLALVNERIKSKIGEFATWDSITTPQLMRGSQTKWNHILARTFLRPRDVISFLNASLQQAKNRAKTNGITENLLFENKDVVSARDRYSNYLKLELDDEIIPHWPHWAEALQACSDIGTVTFERAHFSRNYDQRKSRDNTITADEALKSLHQFSVIAYERRSGYGGVAWSFTYQSPESGWDSKSNQFKLHLGLKEFAKVREDRVSTNSGDDDMP